MLALLATIAATSGCPIANHDRGLADDDHSGSNASAPSGEFVWPVSRSNPILRLEVDMHEAIDVIEIELMPSLAPRCVDSLVRLVRDGYYDGTTFHRVIAGFMIQGGDPNSRDSDPSNDGRGGTSDSLPDEVSRARVVRGAVALSNRGRPNSNSSQFFIMQADDPSLDGRHTIVGRVTSGIDFVDRIARTPTDKVGRWGPKDRPIENVVIRSATISSRGSTTGIRSSSFTEPASPVASGGAVSGRTEPAHPAPPVMSPYQMASLLARTSD